MGQETFVSAGVVNLSEAFIKGRHFFKLWRKWNHLYIQWTSLLCLVWPNTVNLISGFMKGPIAAPRVYENIKL